MFKKVHHIAIICSNYKRSKDFYVNILGFRIVREIYRKERDSYKLDLALGEGYIIELFSFPVPPKRPSFPESTGLRHLAFEVDNIDNTVFSLKAKGVIVEPLRLDPYTGKQFTFFKDPDDMPLEIYEGDNYAGDSFRTFQMLAENEC
ncbi:MAG: VOC family protein [Fusobacteria bacterium]|nr:VOC family protein [Fusobacteriota bacterium]